MDVDSGRIRELKPEELPGPREVTITRAEAKKLKPLSWQQRPAELLLMRDGVTRNRAKRARRKRRGK